MRILTGYMPPTRGKVTLDDYDIVEQSLDVRRKVGNLPETVYDPKQQNPEYQAIERGVGLECFHESCM